ncbi:MAG TPA: CCA tRNA nucleotidyltransferase [Candidatus Deferrimicrobium sp.]|nr:CCA tRNA nucleotidyltransferase [Candidatus Deferrimicrobium sp.]
MGSITSNKLRPIDPFDIPSTVQHILKVLQLRGFESYLVGGCVRDLLLARSPKDYDICTEATPKDVGDIFERVAPIGIKFGTVTVLCGDQHVEVTSMRKPYIPSQDESHHGACKVEADVKLRDFTINALLFDGSELVDYVDGLNDLRCRTIRAVGDAEERFREDPLRLIRAIRFSCQLNFKIETNTYQAIAANAKLISCVSLERVRDELTLLLTSESPAKGIRLLQTTGILQYILPELQKCYRFEQRNKHHDKDVFEHILAVLDHTPNNLLVRLAALLHDVGKPETFTIGSNGVGHFYGHNEVGYGLSKQILSRLKYDKRTVEATSILVKEHMNKLNSTQTKAIKRLINRVGKDKINMLIDLQIADIAGSAPPHDFRQLEELRVRLLEIIVQEVPLELKDLAINGTDLINLGINNGSDIGRMLDKLLQKILDDPELNRRDILLQLVNDYMQ